LKEIITAGSWAIWFTVSEVGLSVRFATVSSGTSEPVGVRAHLHPAQYFVRVGILGVDLKDDLIRVVGGRRWSRTCRVP